MTLPDETDTPDIAADLAWCKQWYDKYPEAFIQSWEVMEPRIVARLNYIHRKKDV